MCSPHFCRVHVTISVLLKGPVILAENDSGENDSFVSSSSGFQITYVIFSVRSVPNHEQSVSSSYSFESLDNKMSIIFWLEPRDIQNITIWFHAPLANGFTIWPSLYLGSVGDHDRRRVMPDEVIVLNYLRVGHHYIRQQGGQVLCEFVIAPAQQAPLFTFVFQAVDIDCHRRAGKSQNGSERGICRIANERDVESSRHGVERREETVNHCVEVLVPDCRQHF